MARIHTDSQFVCSGMKLVTDIKTKIKHIVESSYGFDTSRAPDVISRNTSRAQGLLTKMTFIYQVRLIASPTEHHTSGLQEFNFGGRPNYPYRHPTIQKVINLTWFQDKEDDGVVFYDYFAPIRVETIALALTAVRTESTLPCSGY